MSEIPIIENKKHKSFADFYLRDPNRNARQAYKKVYPKVKDSTADVNASKLLKNTKVLEYINYVENKSTAKTEVTVEWVKKKLKGYAEVSITDFYEIKKGKVVLKDLTKLDPEIVKCIEAIKQTDKGIEIKLVDKKSSTTDLGRHLGMFTDNLVLKPSFEDLLAAREKEKQNQLNQG